MITQIFVNLHVKNLGGNIWEVFWMDMRQFPQQ